MNGPHTHATVTDSRRWEKRFAQWFFRIAKRCRPERCPAYHILYRLAKRIFFTTKQRLITGNTAADPGLYPVNFLYGGIVVILPVGSRFLVRHTIPVIMDSDTLYPVATPVFFINGIIQPNKAPAGIER